MVTAIAMQVEVINLVTGCTVTGTAEAANEMSGCITLRTSAQATVGCNIFMAVFAAAALNHCQGTVMDIIPDLKRAVGRGMTVCTILSWPGCITVIVQR